MIVTVAERFLSFNFSVHCFFKVLPGTITTTIAEGFLACTLSMASKPIFVFSIVIVRLFILTSICYHIAPRTFSSTYFSWDVGHSWEDYILMYVYPYGQFNSSYNSLLFNSYDFQTPEFNLLTGLEFSS